MHAKTTTTRLLATMIAVAATAGVATAADAQGPAKPSYDSVVVNYADLNLDSVAGQQTLYARLSQAASKACGGEPSVREVRQISTYRACVEEKVNRAVDKVSANNQRAMRETARRNDVG